MRVTCICVCHNKPDLVREAIESILRQTHADWEAIVIDSGVLFDVGYYGQFPWRNEPRIRLIRSHETETIRRSKAMAPWCFNEAFRKGWVSGDLVVYLCDDDVFYPHAFETFVAYARKHPEVQAMYASQDLGIIYPNGWHAITGERRANEMGGRCRNGRQMDCEVDYLQFCHRPEVLSQFETNEYWPEAKSTEEHADGIFMERVGQITPIYPIDVKVSQNRRTTRSLNIPFSPVDLMDGLMNGFPILPGVLNRAHSSAVCNSDRPLVTISTTGDHSLALRASIAKQTYPMIEVVETTEADHSTALKRARGIYFLPVGSCISLVPHALERLVERIDANPRLAAVSAYLLGAGSDSVSPKNVAPAALYRISALREITVQLSAPIDWSIFFRFVNAGQLVDVVSEHLFVQSVDGADPEPMLSRFLPMDRAIASERELLWSAMAGYERRLDEMVIANRLLEARLQLMRYRIANRVHSLLSRVPGIVRFLKWCFGGSKSVAAEKRDSNQMPSSLSTPATQLVI